MPAIAEETTQPCPECGMEIRSDSRFTLWCAACDWNVDRGSGSRTRDGWSGPSALWPGGAGKAVLLVKPSGEVRLGPEGEGFVNGVHTERDSVADEDELQVPEPAAGQPHTGPETDLVQEVVDVRAVLPVLDGGVRETLGRHGSSLRRTPASPPWPVRPRPSPPRVHPAPCFTRRSCRPRLQPPSCAGRTRLPGLGAGRDKPKRRPERSRNTSPNSASAPGPLSVRASGPMSVPTPDLRA
jgi:hypothetical protein